MVAKLRPFHLKTSFEYNLKSRGYRCWVVSGEGIEYRIDLSLLRDWRTIPLQTSLFSENGELDEYCTKWDTLVSSKSEGERSTSSIAVTKPADRRLQLPYGFSNVHRVHYPGAGYKRDTAKRGIFLSPSSCFRASRSTPAQRCWLLKTEQGDFPTPENRILG